MNIQVGDRVTYIDSENKRKKVIIDSSYILQNASDLYNIKQILKIERPKYEVIEEKKELLTEEEKAYIKVYTKFNNIKYDELRIAIASIEFINGNSSITCYINTEINFENIEKGKIYKKEELGL